MCALIATIIPVHRVNNLVHIIPATPELKRVESGIFGGTRPQFDDRPSFGTLAFLNGLECRNSDFSWLIGSHYCTSCNNLVRFGSGVYDVRICTAGVDNFQLRSLERGCLGTAAISGLKCFISIR